MLSNAIMLNAHTVKIQTSKTCEHVELDDLKDDVKRSVLAAALGSDDPCASRKNIGGVKIEGEEQTASKAVGGLLLDHRRQHVLRKEGRSTHYHGLRLLHQV